MDYHQPAIERRVVVTDPVIGGHADAAIGSGFSESPTWRRSRPDADHTALSDE